MSDLEVFRRAERLEWHAHTVFDGDKPGGDGNIDGDLRAINGDQITASMPLDIFTSDDEGHAPLRLDPGGPLGQIVANPRTWSEVGEEVRRWCQRELGRDDVMVD